MEKLNSSSKQLPALQPTSNNFWNQIGEKDHVVQFYNKDNELIDTLVNYVVKGFENNDRVVLICTNEHLLQVNQAVENRGYDLNEARSIDQYITLDAIKVLEQFMVNDWPVKALFRNAIVPIIERASSGSRQIRAFGEMVMLLWNRGLQAATIQLENLWNELANEYDFYLFCAYANIGFDDSQKLPLHHICKSHSKIIRGSDVEGELLIEEA